VSDSTRGTDLSAKGRALAMVIIGPRGDGVTRFTYLEYQAIMLSLASFMCFSLWLLEVSLQQFQVLPLFFPGMFAVRKRRFYIYDVDISDGQLGQQIRGQAKMMLRMTTCLVIAYVWQHCVMETFQSYGQVFPRRQCDQDFDCFASEIHFLTFFSRQHQAINCSAADEPFVGNMVISCIRFVPPTASDWLKHLAISYSVTQLNLKSFEVIVWASSKSLRLRMLLTCMNYTAALVFAICFFTGAMTTFLDSWLSFVMTFSVPCFLYVTWKAGAALDVLQQQEESKRQQDLAQNIDTAFDGIEQFFEKEEEMKRSPSRERGGNEDPRTPKLPLGADGDGKGVSTILKNFLKGKAQQLPAVFRGRSSSKSPR
jgi:hypothetical protein